MYQELSTDVQLEGLVLFLKGFRCVNAFTKSHCTKNYGLGTHIYLRNDMHSFVIREKSVCYKLIRTKGFQITVMTPYSGSSLLDHAVVFVNNHIPVPKTNQLAKHLARVRHKLEDMGLLGCKNLIFGGDLNSRVEFFGPSYKRFAPEHFSSNHVFHKFLSLRIDYSNQNNPDLDRSLFDLTFERDSLDKAVFTETLQADSAQHKMIENKIDFWPSYKRNPTNGSFDLVETNGVKRLPGFADRVFADSDRFTAVASELLSVSGSDHVPLFACFDFQISNLPRYRDG